MKYKFILISLGIIILDQITKSIFTNKSFGIINYATNTGAAFSLFQDYIFGLILFSIAISLLILYFYKKYPKLYLPLAFIFGGSIGNLIDRISLGYVKDFIDLKIWPIFNIADSFNVIGVSILIYLILKEKV